MGWANPTPIAELKRQVAGRRRIEQELQRAKEQLAVALEDRDRFRSELALRGLGLVGGKPARSSADICRRNGWKVGTLLVGDDGADEQRVTITAIGLQLVLAVDRRHAGEFPLDLSWRRWHRAGIEGGLP